MIYTFETIKCQRWKQDNGGQRHGDPQQRFNTWASFFHFDLTKNKHFSI